MKQALPVFVLILLVLCPACSDDESSPPIPVVSSITIADVANFGDGRDLEVSFNKVGQEELVSAYRIILVKAANAGSFTVESAKVLTADRYTQLNADNTNKKFNLSQDAKDNDGSTITEGQSYMAFVLTVGKNETMELSEASNPLTLALPDTPTVGVILISDISNFGDGRDLRVVFGKVIDESLITEYRIIIVKSTMAATFTLSVAEILSPANYTVAAKDGINKNLTLTQTTKDSSGELIMQDHQYAAFVLTIGAGRNTAQHKLSASSNTLTVQVPAAPAVTALSSLDVSNNANGKDIEIAFNKASNENMVSSYRAIVVKESSVATFNLVAAEALTANQYHTISKAGTNLQQELRADLLDSEGDAIQESVSYKLFVMSLADGTQAGKNSLSSPSGSITLLQKNAVRTFATFPGVGTGGLQVDADGNIYFGNFGLTTASPGGEVYKITPAGESSVYATGLMAADGNDFDSDGNFYTVSWQANQIVKVTPTGVRSVFASGGMINGPIGITIDVNNTLFVTCYNNNTVIKITSSGVVSVLSNSALLNGPNGIDTDAAGNIYVSNWNNANIMKLNKDTGGAELFVTTPSSNNAHLVIKNDIIYVSGRSHHKVFKVTLSKVITDFLGTGVGGARNGLVTSATIYWPNDIAFNSDGTKMYVSMVNPSVTSQDVFGPAIIREISLVE